MTTDTIRLLGTGVLLYQKHWQSDQDGDPRFGNGDLMRSCKLVLPQTESLWKWVAALSQHVPLVDIEHPDSEDPPYGIRFALPSTHDSVHDYFWLNELPDARYAEFADGNKRNVLAEFMEEYGHAWTAAQIVGTGHVREAELRRAACKAADYLDGLTDLDEAGVEVRRYLRVQHGACEIAAHDDVI